MKKANEAVATSILYDPENENMVNNMKFYITEMNLPSGWFVPRPSEAARSRRNKEEQKLLDFIEDSFVFETKKLTGKDEL